MVQINKILSQMAHNYFLVAIAATLFFLAKAITGYLTYRHYDKKFKRIEEKLDKIIQKL
ncbi:hypothetical protein [Bacillus sp. V5-8f]|uniref:hypothetical protein n=1 Tax=Bacillus sp. V5-8f TaxID=2053044 RepID=UPI0015E13DB6|nr:hypothetical protein [Bacillus sp. V5-8f]